MSEKNYMADPASEFVENLGIGGSLQPDVISVQAAKVFQQAGGRLAEITDALRVAVAKRHWIGKLGDATRDETEDLARTSKTAGETVQEYGQSVQSVAESATTAKSVCDQNSQCTPGTSPMAQVKAVARALQNHYGEPGQKTVEDLQYPGRTPDAPTEDRGESPDGPTGAQPQPSSGGGASSGGVPQSEPAASSAAAKPQAQDDATGAQPEAQTDGKPSGESAGAGSGSGSGGGAGSGDAGKGSGAGGGSPFGGTPAAGAQSSSSGFDPSESGATHAMSAGDSTFGSSSGSSGLGGGGVGTLGGDHERSLSAKSGPGGLMGGKPVVNVNGLGGSGVGQGAGMGGGMGGMGVGAAGQNSGKEHKTPDYLKGEDNGNELFGGNLPVVAPEVIGELNKDEYQKMLEAQAKTQAAAGGA